VTLWKGWSNLVNFNKNRKKEKNNNNNSDNDIDIDPLKRKPKQIEYYDDPNLLQNRPWFQRAIVLSGGIVFNIVLAFACYFGELTIGTGLPTPIFDQGVLITQEPRYDGASYGLLKKGDVIVRVNGNSITRFQSPRAAEAQDDISKFISSIRETKPGDSLNLSVLRPASSNFILGRTDNVVIPRSDTKPIERVPLDIIVTPAPLGGAAGVTSSTTAATTTTTAGKNPMSIGVMLAPNYLRTDVIKANGIMDATTKAGTAVWHVTSDTARSILTLLGRLLSGRGIPAGQSVSGPIGVIKAGSDVVATNDVRAVIGFAAAISVNLAVINALPLPALDGGQLVFVLAEGITGKKIDQRLQENINAAVLLLLFFVSVGTAIGDVEAIIAFGR